jgi:hypothetical protein
MIELALRAHLLTLEALTALVAQRIYIDLSPQQAPLPRIVLRLLPGAARQYHATAPTDMVMADVECTIQANAYPACHTMYGIIRDALDKQSGEWNGTTLDVARVTPPHSRLNLPIHGDEQGVPSLVCTVETTFRE